MALWRSLSIKRMHTQTHYESGPAVFCDIPKNYITKIEIKMGNSYQKMKRSPNERYK